MVDFNFFDCWEQLASDPVAHEIIDCLCEVDGYLSDVYITDFDIENQLIATRVVNKNAQGGCYPGANFLAFLGWLDNYTD